MSPCARICWREATCEGSLPIMVPPAAKTLSALLPPPIGFANGAPAPDSQTTANSKAICKAKRTATRMRCAVVCQMRNTCAATNEKPPRCCATAGESICYRRVTSCALMQRDGRDACSTDGRCRQPDADSVMCAYGPRSSNACALLLSNACGPRWMKYSVRMPLLRAA